MNHIQTNHYIRTYLPALLLCMCIWAPLHAQPRKVTARHVHGLFLSDRITLHKGLNCMVVAKEKEFEKTFGLTSAQAHGTGMPDMDKENLLVLALPPSNRDAELNMTTAITAGNFVEMQCHVVRKNYPLSYTTYPLTVVAVPKYKGVNTYRFYEGRRLLATVTIK